MQPIRRNKRTVLQFRLTDSLSGIGSDRDISVMIDSLFVVPEWDPERDLVYGHLPSRLPAGMHTIRFRVSDRAGNRREQIFHWRSK